MKTKIKLQTIDEKVKEYVQKETELLQSLGLKKRLIILFPKQKGKRPNFFSRFAVSILRSQGGIIDSEFSEIKK